MSDRHPLDPLDAAELARAVAIARDAPGLSDQVAVVSVEAREPEKADYLAWKSSGPDLPREAFLVLLDNGRRRGVEAVVSLDDDRLVSCADLAEGVQPAMHGDEFVAVAAALRADEGFVKRCAVAGSTTRPSCTSSRGRAARSSPVRLGKRARSPGCGATTTATTPTRARCTAWSPRSISTT